MNWIIKRPSAWIPLALSLIVVLAWVIGVATFGVPKPEPDEGTAAHLFQIWLILEVLLVAVFAIKWLPQNPKQAFPVFFLQIVGILAGSAPVYLLKL